MVKSGKLIQILRGGDEQTRQRNTNLLAEKVQIYEVSWRWEDRRKGIQVITVSSFKENRSGTSLVVQWVRLRAPNAGGPGVRSLVGELDPAYMPQLRAHMRHN